MDRQETEQKIIDQILLSLGKYDLGDIKYYAGLTNQEPKPILKPLAIYILCACFIDHLAQYNFYDPSRTKEAGPRFLEFVRTYMKNYDAVKLYTALRSNLVHNYSTNSQYILDWTNQGIHLSTFIDADGKPRIWLNLIDFIAEIERVFDEFAVKLLNLKSTERKNALAHYTEFRILQEFKAPITR